MTADPKRVAVFGAGYVGLVTGACFAELGHHVVIRDVIPDRVAALRRGEVPIHEPGLDELLARNAERLAFTTDVAVAIDEADFVYVAVGTPPTFSGDADLTAVWTVIDELPKVDRRIVVVMKSTVPVGTGLKIRHRLDERGMTQVGYASNPEFTAEGTAVRDFMHPDRVVVGAFDSLDADAVEALHRGIDGPVVRADVASAEMIKLAANAALMTRISFINEIANVCEATGADVVKVAEGIGLDRRIGPSFLRAGIGFGGSCLVGEETVVMRAGSRTWLTRLDALHRELDAGQGRDLLEVRGLQVLAWRPGASAAEFLPISHVTSRPYDGDVVELRTKMGRRLVCTDDHPLLVGDGASDAHTVRTAGELTANDWLPIALGAPVGEDAILDDVLEGIATEGLRDDEVIVRPAQSVIQGATAQRVRRVLRSHPRGNQRVFDVARSGVLRLPEAFAADVSLEGAALKTARNGTEVPFRLDADVVFWRIAGLYAAEGHCSADGRRRRLQWSFHPTNEGDLVEEVASFWRDRGVKVDIRRHPTTQCVVISSRILAGWWLGSLGLGSTCYDQRVPDLLWGAPLEHKRAFLSGVWHGDGSWSRLAGDNVVLEYGTVSRVLADGVLRLLGELGIVGRLKIGRSAKSTVDAYFVVVSGAEQVKQLLELVRAPRRAEVSRLVNRVRGIRPTGYRRFSGSAWVRVVETKRRTFSGRVYSLEVPDAHTFVTTNGLVVHNCFPKDSLALKQLAANSGYHFQLLNAVIEVNELQKRRVVGKLAERLGTLRGTTVALLGLAFKPNTDDVREAPAFVLAGRLLAEGADVRVWDPVASADGLHGVEQVATVAEAAAGADAVVLVTEWQELSEVDWAAVGKTMARPVFIDGRNFLEPAAMRAAGFTYDAIGRAADAKS